eukprot:717583-Pelagomonas_calceolata.AAC.9
MPDNLPCFCVSHPTAYHRTDDVHKHDSQIATPMMRTTMIADDVRSHSKQGVRRHMHLCSPICPPLTLS